MMQLAENMKPKKINFSDIPELSEAQLSRMRQVNRSTASDAPRKLIAIRLDANILGWLRKTAEKKGLPYHSLVNEILVEEMKNASWSILTPDRHANRVVAFAFDIEKKIAEDSELREVIYRANAQCYSEKI
jgi:uncharacterized protein (DUF4415 family)